MAQLEDAVKAAPASGAVPQGVAHRASSSNISVSEASIDDLPAIVSGLYASFPTQFWDRKEPPALRPPTNTIRHERMVTRVRPTFSEPHMHWVVAKHSPTDEIVGAAAWVGPGNPVHEFLRRDAIEFYGWREQFGSDEELEKIWSHVDDKAWSGHFVETDELRKEVLGDEPHWYLASLFTLPEWQGKGIGKLLLDWAIRQADATDPVTPMYLESSLAGRKVYMKNGFVPQGGESNMLRRGPAFMSVEGRDDGKQQGLA